MHGCRATDRESGLRGRGGAGDSRRHEHADEGNDEQGAAHGSNVCRHPSDWKGVTIAR